MKSNSKKILVTGGAGLIGSHLCERLIAEGHLVICLDNLSSGEMANIHHLLSNSRFKFVKHDITVSCSFEVDEIYNLACPASPIQYKIDPVQTMKTCLLGSMNLLELAKKNGSKILQASTSEVYGDPEVHPQPEVYWGNTNPIGERSCYNEAKRAAEALFYNYWRQYGVRIKIARIFNTYGPRMHQNDGRVISNFIQQALKNEALTLYGDGTQTRSFCYVDDLVEGLTRLMDLSDDFIDPMNLGNPSEMTMIELAKGIIRRTGSSSQFSFHTLPKDDPKKRCPTINRAKELLDWAPKISFDEGIKKTIDYYKEKN